MQQGPFVRFVARLQLLGMLIEQRGQRLHVAAAGGVKQLPLEVGLHDANLPSWNRPLSASWGEEVRSCLANLRGGLETLYADRGPPWRRSWNLKKSAAFAAPRRRSTFQLRDASAPQSRRTHHAP